MAIISQQESFLLKFRQENSSSELQPISVSVVKENDIYIVELRGEKKNASVKIDANSLREISQYIDSKIHVKGIQKNSPTTPSQAPVEYLPNSPYTLNVAPSSGISLGSAGVGVGENVGSVADLINDMSSNVEKTFYLSQADLIISNGADISSF